MTTIGYATLQIIPSLEGVSDAVDKQLGGKLRVMGTQQGKQFSRGVGVGLKDLERDVDSAGRAYQKLKDKAADALGKVRTEEAALKRLRDSGASDDRVIRSEERLAAARRNSSRASREASDGHKALEAAQGASAASAVVAGGAFGKLSTLAAGAGTALLSAGAIAGGAALAGIAALGAGVLVAGNRLYELGAQFDDLSDNLQIKTGLSGAALEELKGHIEKLGTTNVPSTFAEIGNVAAEVTRNLHLTGPAFDDVTSRLANLQRMGVDVDVRSLGKAFRGFGIDAQAQAPALNSLYEASTKSGLSIDDLTGAVTKGGPALRQLGLDFGASAALIANFEAAGLDGEKGMTALTKATTYFAKQNIPAKQGLQDTIAQIQKLGDQPAAVDLANKVFGAKGGAAFNEAIQNGTLDLQSLSDSLSTTGIDINQVSDDTADWSEKWQILKNNVSSALEPMATGLFDAVNEQLAGLSDSLLAHKDEIVGFFETLGDLAITGAENMSHGIGGILQALGDMVGGIGNVKGVLDDLMGDFATLRGDNAAATAFHASAQEAYGWGESLRAAGDKLANLNLDGLRQGLHNVGDAARTSNTEVGGLGSALGALPSDKSITVHADTAPAEETMQAWWKKWKSVIAAAPGGGDDTDHPVIHSTDKPPPGSSAVQPVPSLLDPNRPQFRATGGPVVGAGGPKSDIIPLWASNGEHMLTASDVQAMGGQAGVYAFRNMLHRSGGGSILPMAQIPWPPGKINKTGDRAGNLPNLDSGFNPSQRALPWLLDPDSPIPSGPPGVPLPPTDDDILFPDLQPPWIQDWLKKHPPSSWKNPRRNMLLGAGLGFANGGAIGPDVRVAGELVGTAYSQAKRTDCSGMVARVIDRTLGMSEAGLMSTKNAKEWLAARGFVAGIGGPGQISVGWYDHGPNPNDGHMAMTLSDGSNAEAGGGVGDIFQIGGGAAGASSPEFDQHMYLPTVYGEGPASSGSASSPFAGGSATAAATGAAPTSSSSGDAAPSSSTSSSVSVPSSLSGLAGWGLGDLGKGVGKTGSGSDLSLFGGAAESAVTGQVDSLLGVLGVPGTPGWLQGISSFIGGIKIGGGSSANPLSANPQPFANASPGDAANMHGTHAGQAPGPTYNITARDTEDAFIKAQRLEREKAAAKLSRF